MISNKQKNGIEKISGKGWEEFSPIGVDAYFAFTDLGILRDCKEPDFTRLMEYHRQHPITIGVWENDFKKGLLFLWDFLLPEYPESYIKHAFQTYKLAMGFIPRCYREHHLCPKEFKINGVKNGSINTEEGSGIQVVKH